MSTADLIKIGISVVVFVLCLVLNIHFKGVLKTLKMNATRKNSKRKKD
jgi:hypothetical protein